MLATPGWLPFARGGHGSYDTYIMGPEFTVLTIHGLDQGRGLTPSNTQPPASFLALGGVRLPPPVRRAQVQGYKISTRERPDVEGATVGPKERERRLAKHLIDRSHRRRGLVVRKRRLAPWTLGEKAALVVSLAFIFAGMIQAVVVFLLEPPLP